MPSRLAGAVAPLFSLRSHDDWGVGQISHLPACARWLKAAGIRLLQILPPHELQGDETSPYGARTAFGLDPVYIDIGAVPELSGVPAAEFLSKDDMAALEVARAAAQVDYRTVRALKAKALGAAFDRFADLHLGKGTERDKAFAAFREREASWLLDYALYAQLRASHNGHGWSTWPDEERTRQAGWLARRQQPSMADAEGRAVLLTMFTQFVAFTQWDAMRDELRALGVELMGDLPFIVGSESACVWSRQSEFLQSVSLGAPPDDFSADGQDWGLPAYDWQAMDPGNLRWLRQRAEHAARLYDRFRIDHVVGFFRMWIKDHGATRGYFSPQEPNEQDARGRKVLSALKTSAGPAQIIAEDLGVIPPFVRRGLAELGLPGYKVLPWERGDDNRLRDPAQFPGASVATYSTHDTAPITQWWDDFKPWEKTELAAMAGFDASSEGTVEREHKLIDLLLRSGSELALLLVTELIGDRARINLPGTVGPHNWTYRLPRGIHELGQDPELAQRLARIKASVESAHRA